LRPRTRLPPPSLPFPYTTLFRSQQAVGAARHSDAVQRVQMNDAAGILAHLVDGRMDGKARRVDAVLTLRQLIAIEVDLDQAGGRSEEHTSELQSHLNLVCRLRLE